MSKTINIAKEFSEFPSGRYLKDGPYSGEKFRQEHLLPALREGDQKITIFLDGVLGYPVSFSDEAFGGLVRIDHYDKNELLNRLDITFHAPHYEPYKQDMIDAIEEASFEQV